MSEEINTKFVNLGDVAYDKNIIPTDASGNPEQLAPLGGILDLFKKKEIESASKVIIDGVQSDLNVVHLDADSYYKLILDNKIDLNTMYVLSSSILNAYGQQIKNVAEPSDDNDASTKKYVDSKIQDIRDKVKTLAKIDEKSATSYQVVKTVNSIIDVLKSI